MKFKGFIEKDLTRTLALAVEARNNDVISVSDFIGLLEQELAGRRKSRKVVDASKQQRIPGHGHYAGQKCPSCGRGLLVARERDSVRYMACKFYSQPGDPEHEPQGCGWSTLVGRR